MFQFRDFFSCVDMAFYVTFAKGQVEIKVMMKL